MFYFDFNGAEVFCKWNCDDRFSDPEVVYDIMLQLLYQAEDAPAEIKPTDDPEPMGFVWGEESPDDDEADEEEGPLIERYWK